MTIYKVKEKDAFVRYDIDGLTFREYDLILHAVKDKYDLTCDGAFKEALGNICEELEACQ